MTTLYERFARTEDGPRHLAVARLKREVLRALNVALRESGLSQTQLAERLKVRKSAVSQALHGDGNLRVKTIAEYLEALGYELDVRLVEAGEPRKAVVENRDVKPAFPRSAPEPPRPKVHDFVHVAPVQGGHMLINMSIAGDAMPGTFHFEGDIHHVPEAQAFPAVANPKFKPLQQVNR